MGRPGLGIDLGALSRGTGRVQNAHSNWLNGRRLEGPNAIAGECGHNPLPLRPCRCGRAGCIETTLCGPAPSREREIEGGAPLARTEARRARALTGVINLLDRDVIVLGSGVSNLDRLYANVPRL